jgi:hypothetical protein
VPASPLSHRAEDTRSPGTVRIGRCRNDGDERDEWRSVYTRVVPTFPTGLNV